jgi:bifunctional UDP-N-acetylglucosamine pyrophosphorylase/glucosamine-1-phosphate N-acetyltransferase
VLLGVNDRAQLGEAEDKMHARIRLRWQRSGVTVRQGSLIDDAVEIEPDAVIGPFAVLRGKTRVGSGARVDVGSVLDDMSVGAGTHVKPYSVMTRSRVGERAEVGPFSHLRPESDLGDEVHIGNFVEAKKTRMAKGSKANHLAYLGDGVIGERANIGAGTIFCNYDGVQKHTTTIEAEVFIGSDSQLVAPVTIGKGAYVATGTTVTKDVPPDALAIARIKQDNKEGYAPRLRARMKAAKEAKSKSK